MRFRWQILALAGMLIAGALLTLANLRGARVDAVTAELGVRPTQREEARQVDEAVLKAVERRYFGTELRERLNKPSTIVQLDTFLIDRCEVKQLDYERFIEWSEARSGAPIDSASDLWSASSGDRIAGRLQSPATGVTLEGAQTYCSAIGGRLPWARELEAAASGPEARFYPWGNAFRPDAWPYENPDRNSQQECGVHPSTSTPDGIHDLASNAMEWSLGRDTGPSTPNSPAAHGAPAVRTSGRALYALNAAWLEVDPTTRSHHLGFRCVYGVDSFARAPWGGPSQNVALIRRGNYRIGLASDIRLARLAALVPMELQGRFRLLVANSSVRETITAERCEVTRAEYVRFLRDPLVLLGWFGNEGEPSGIDYVPSGWEAQIEEPQLPVTGIDWWSADAYARWAGGRLPTIDEWQRLSAGLEGHIYPWGDAYDPDRLGAGDGRNAVLRECGSAAGDQTDSGIYDIAGNVSEWTRSIDIEGSRLSMWVGGGNWLLPGSELARSVSGRRVPLPHRSAGIGLRVVYD